MLTCLAPTSPSRSTEHSGARVRELSAPLAAAGISILYQSSYMSDFIFVKAPRLAEVMALLAEAGFDLYSSDPHNLTSQMSPLLSPTASDDAGSLIFDGLAQDDARHAISSQSSVVLSRTRSPSLASLPLAVPYPSAADHGRSRGLGAPAELQLSTSISPCSDSTVAPGIPTLPTPRMHVKKSLSPTSAPVDVLPSDLVCVGLSDAQVDVWSLKILKLVAFPELIAPAPAPKHAASNAHRARTPLLAAEIFHRGKAALGSDADLPLHRGWLSSDDSGDDAPPRSPASASSACSSSAYGSGGSEDEDEEYDSSPPSARRPGMGTGMGSPPTPSLVSGWSSSTRSLPDLELLSTLSAQWARESASLRKAAAECVSTDVGVDVDVAADPDKGKGKDGLEADADAGPEAGARVRAGARAGRAPASRVPFFSFTRTQEGSSLTTDVRVLAALFQPSERHMVICREALLEAADRQRERELEGADIFEMEMEMEVGDGEGFGGGSEGTMRCLQIDLRKFGLGAFASSCSPDCAC